MAHTHTHKLFNGDTDESIRYSNNWIRLIILLIIIIVELNYDQMHCLRTSSLDINTQR